MSDEVQPFVVEGTGILASASCSMGGMLVSTQFPAVQLLKKNNSNLRELKKRFPAVSNHLDAAAFLNKR